MKEIKSELIKAIVSAVVGLLIGYISHKISADKEIETTKNRLFVAESSILKSDSLINAKDFQLRIVNTKLDSIGHVNECLVGDIKGSVKTIENLLEHNRINNKDKQEALKWLDQK
jgi:hypothetical protein